MTTASIAFSYLYLRLKQENKTEHRKIHKLIENIHLMMAYKFITISSKM